MKYSILFMGLLIGFTGTGWCIEIFVDPVSGSDLGSGTESDPLKSLWGAITIADNDDTITLEDGIYTGSDNWDINVGGKALIIRSRSGAENCIIDCDDPLEAAHRAFIFNSGETETTILDGLTIINGVSNNNGGAIYCLNSSPIIQNCVFKNNRALNGGAIYYSNSVTRLVSCVIVENMAQGEDEISLNGNGGGIGCENDVQLIVEKCLISNNSATRNGGGVYLYDIVDLTVVNSLIFGNTTNSFGGAIYTQDGPMILINTVIHGNTASSRGGGIRLFDTSSTSILNTIMWDNIATDGTGNEIAVNLSTDPLQTLQVSHSDIEGSFDNIFFESEYTLDWDESNINADPLFTNAIPEEWEISDYRLTSGSPCINAGDNDAISGYATDIVGNTRVLNTDVDMGAYEFSSRAIVVTQVKTKAHVGRDLMKDSILVKADIDLTSQELVAAQSLSINVRSGDYVKSFADILLADGKLNKGKFIYKNKINKVMTLKLDTVKGLMILSIKNIDLTGLSAPLAVEVFAGDYIGIGNADEAIVNGDKKPIDMLFMRGYADALAVSKAIFKLGKEANTNQDMIKVIGTMATADADVDLSNKEIAINWGGFEATIPAQNSMVQRGQKYTYVRSKELVSEPGNIYIDKALFDLLKGKFFVQVSKTNIGVKPETVDFSLTIDTFSETVSVTY